MIELEVTDQTRNAFAVSGDEPMTVTFVMVDEHVVAEVYRGTPVTEYDEPIGAYDNTDTCETWRSEVTRADENGTTFTLRFEYPDKRDPFTEAAWLQEMGTARVTVVGEEK